jgi:dolichol-phosphate mannosyltransferase
MTNEVTVLQFDQQSPATAAVKLSVIAPTYNETQCIGALISTLEQSLAGIDYEIIISDDDSPDLTWAHAEQLAKLTRRLRVLRRMSNRGLGPAVVEAFAIARGQAVACIDADLQHDPNILPEMLKALERGSELVVGSRYVAGGGTANWSWARRFTSSTATTITKCLLGIKIRDPMSGYFMLRRTDFMRVRPLLKISGFKILLEIAAQMQPGRITEVPYTFRPRAAGDSKLSSKVMFAFLLQLLRLVSARRFTRTRIPAEAHPAPLGDAATEPKVPSAT